MRVGRSLGWAARAVAGLGGLVLVVGLATVAAGPDDDEPEAKPARTGRKSAKPDYIDGMLEDAWKAAKVKPSPVASDSEFVRRAYLDILGRIPSEREAVEFLELRDGGKRAKLIEHLLSHPDYAKNFGNLWTILLLGRTQRDSNMRVDRAALANWLRRQFTENRPWNEVVGELVAAKGSNKENGAVNFTLAHMQEGAVNLTSMTTRVFLGQQIQCTQCHDHPSNDWKQDDFWSINAFYKGLRTEVVRKADAKGAEVIDHVDLDDEPTDAPVFWDRRNATKGISFPRFLDGRKISPGTDVERRPELAKFIAGADNGQLPRAFVNRLWGHFLGRGFVNPVDDFGDHNPPSHPELLDRLASDFAASGYDVKALIRWITASRAYQASSVLTKDNEKDEGLFSRMALKPMTPEQLFDSLITATSAHKTGGGRDTDRLRAQWLRQFVVAFANDEEGEANTFQGTIPQALMMMNGELMTRAVGGQPGSYLRSVLDSAALQRRVPADRYIVERLYMAALGRAPNPVELRSCGRALASNPDQIGVVQDLFWALLNSNEFILNH